MIGLLLVWLSTDSYTLHVPDRKPTTGILLLHGAGRDHQTLAKDPATRKAIESTWSLVVMPNGGKSWWLDATPVLQLIDKVSHEYKIARWAVGGWSMGGFGSLRLIVGHPKRFTAWAALLPLVDFPNPAYPPEQNHSVPDIFGPPERWPQWNPFNAVERLRGKQIWFLTGSTAFDRSMNQSLDRKLTALHIPHTFRIAEGRHEFRLVAENLPDLLAFLENALDATAH